MEALLGLIGVFLGWSLGEVSSALRRSRDERLMIGKVLASLITLRDEMQTSQAAIEGLKSLGLRVDDFEKHRKSASARYVDKTPGLEGTRLRLLEDLAGFMPIESQELQWVLRSYSFLPNVDLSGHASLDHEAYVMALSTIETAILLGRRRLSEIIYRVAWKHGIYTWMRLRIRDRKAKHGIPELGEKNPEWVAELIKRVMPDGKRGVTGQHEDNAHDENGKDGSQSNNAPKPTQ